MTETATPETKPQAKVLLFDASYQITTIGLDFTGQELSFERWEVIGQTLSGMHRGIQWALGDWILYGEKRRTWQHQLAGALAITDFSPDTLESYKKIAAKFPYHRRRPNLSFSHHMTVAYLPPIRADELLEKAESFGWTVQQLDDVARGKEDSFLTPLELQSEGMAKKIKDEVEKLGITPTLSNAKVLYLGLNFTERQEFRRWIKKN